MAVALRKPSTFAQYKTLLRKDLEQEFRTREMLTSMGIYAVLVLVVFGAALGQTTPALDLLQVAGGLLWALIVFTSLLGLNRSMAGIGTLLSTITVNTRGKDVMLAVLFVPFVFPLLYACASSTTALLVGAEGYMDVFVQSIALAGGYDVIMLLLSWVLYDFVISA